MLDAFLLAAVRIKKQQVYFECLRDVGLSSSIKAHAFRIPCWMSWWTTCRRCRLRRICLDQKESSNNRVQRWSSAACRTSRLREEPAGRRGPPQSSHYKQRAEVAKDLKTIYFAAVEAEAEFNLELFAEKWDQQYPYHQQIVASTLDSRHPAVQLPGRDPQGDLYHECDWVSQYDDAQSHQESSDISLWWCCLQGVIPSYPEYYEKMVGTYFRLESCFKLLFHRVCGTVSAVNFIYLTHNAWQTRLCLSTQGSSENK